MKESGGVGGVEFCVVYTRWCSTRAHASHANFNDGHIHLLPCKEKQGCDDLKLENGQSNFRRPQFLPGEREKSWAKENPPKQGGQMGQSWPVKMVWLFFEAALIKALMAGNSEA